MGDVKQTDNRLMTMLGQAFLLVTCFVGALTIMSWLTGPGNVNTDSLQQGLRQWLPAHTEFGGISNSAMVSASSSTSGSSQEAERPPIVIDLRSDQLGGLASNVQGLNSTTSSSSSELSRIAIKMPEGMQNLPVDAKSLLSKLAGAAKSRSTGHLRGQNASNRSYAESTASQVLPGTGDILSVQNMVAGSGVSGSKQSTSSRPPNAAAVVAAAAGSPAAGGTASNATNKTPESRVAQDAHTDALAASAKLVQQGLQQGQHPQTAAQLATSSCVCTRVDAQQLITQCSVKGRDWPAKSDELAAGCMDFLANNATQYLVREQHASSANISCSKQLLVHTFWSGKMNWKLKAVIQSFLFTHYTEGTSCRPKPVLTVWLATEQPTRELLQQWAKEWDAPYFACSDQLQFRHWSSTGWLDWLPERFLTGLGGNATVDMVSLRKAVNASAAAGSRVSYSDAVRFLALYTYGGIYTDGDVLLLRNLEPLHHLGDFVHEWSFVPEGVNTAVMGAVRHSPFAGAVIQTALRAAVRFNSTTGQLTFDPAWFSNAFHPMSILRRVPPKIKERVVLLPSMPFDPIWLTADSIKVSKLPRNNSVMQLHKVNTFADVFSVPREHMKLPIKATDLFKGAFTYHWHNNWHQPLVETSIMGRWVDLFNRFLSGQEPGPYGNVFVPCAASSVV